MTAHISIDSWLDHASHLRYVLGFHPSSAVVISVVCDGKMIAVAHASVGASTHREARHAAQRCVEQTQIPEDGYGIVTAWACSEAEVPTLLTGISSAWQHPRLMWGGLVVEGHYRREPHEAWADLGTVDTSVWAGIGATVHQSRALRCSSLDHVGLVPAGGVAETVRAWARCRSDGPHAHEEPVRFRCVAHTEESELGRHAAIMTRALHHNAALARECRRVLSLLPSHQDDVLCCLCEGGAEALTVELYRWLLEGYQMRVPLALRPRWWLLLAVAAYRCGDTMVAREAARRALRDPSLARAAVAVDVSAQQGPRPDLEVLAVALHVALCGPVVSYPARRHRGASVHKGSGRLEVKRGHPEG